MDEKLKSLWANNKILFCLLLPLIILLFFKDVLLQVLAGSARKIGKEAELNDAKLKAEQDALNAEADRLKKEALESLKNEPKIDEDWNRK